MSARIIIALTTIVFFGWFIQSSSPILFAYPGPDPKPICTPGGNVPYPGSINSIRGDCNYIDGIYLPQTNTAGNDTTQSSAGNSMNGSGATTPKEVPEADTLILLGSGIAGLGAWLRWRRIRKI